MQHFIHWGLLGIAGVVGVCARYAITMLIPKIAQINIPILIVNVLGSVCMGLFYNKFHQDVKQPLYIWASVGFCGGFTTFSSFTLDALLLLQQHKLLTAVLYATLSIILCLLATWLGMRI